ncbi:lipoprotein 17-related variable surface protein [Mycoplasma sp. ATU-Cv-508]|uniref:lipoprotein 17-related variable surface protein n=1 Tax=Mycoplasma sp. ATU-Cv-508 TaxID=2048001 RepID=UPI001374B83D
MTVKSDHAQRSREIVVKGYGTLEELLEKVFEIFVKHLSRAKLADRLPSQVGSVKQLVTFADLNLPELDYQSRKGVGYKMIVNEVDDHRGLLTLILELDKDGSHVVKKYTLENLMTLSQYEEKVLVEKVNSIRKLNNAQNDEGKIAVKITNKSAFYEYDIAKISVEDVKNNLDEFSIRLPDDLDGVKLEWISVKPLVTNNLLLVDLQISFGQASQKLTFEVTGFLTMAGKMIRDVIESIPAQLTTQLKRKLATDFEEGRIYDYRDLGIAPFDLRLDIFGVDLMVRGVDNRLGIVHLNALVSSGGEMQSKKIEVDGFWNDSEREAARRLIPGQMHNFFRDFYFDTQISKLSEQKTKQLPAFDNTSNNINFIGNHAGYQNGQEIAWEDLNLVKKASLIRQWLADVDKDYKLIFKVVERPDHVYFNGSIRVQPLISFVDQKISLPNTIVIGGFQTFEQNFQKMVEYWSGQINYALKTSSKGIALSLIKALEKTKPGLTRVSEFKKLTGLGDVLKDGPRIGSHKMIILDVDWKSNQDPKSYHSPALHFQFLTGLQGPESDYFNKRKLDDENLQPREVIAQHRSFFKLVTGFKTKDDVIKVVTKELQKHEFLKWDFPEQIPHAKDVDYSGLRGPKDFGHLRGVLSEMYGHESLPEFHPEYLRENKKRDLLDKFARQGEWGKNEGENTLWFRYETRGNVAGWLKKIGKFNHFSPWNKVPIDYEHLWKNSDPSTRDLFASARLYFKFLRYLPSHNTMFFHGRIGNDR